MRVALIGAFGQLGTDLQKTLGDDVTLLGHRDVEITEPDSIQRALDALQPAAVLNTAAYNLVDQAEAEPSLAFKVNAFGPRNLAAYCGPRNITLMHVSTDYVFGLDHRRTLPYREQDCPGPLSVYGASKLAGESFVRSLCSRHFVVRSCGLYGWKSTRGKGNFIETMLRLGRERDELSVVNDQRCTPTFTADLADALARLLSTDEFGLYHATNSGETTWYHLAQATFELAGLQVKLHPITTAEFGAKAQRPPYSVLSTQKLASVIGQPLPEWRDALRRYLR